MKKIISKVLIACSTVLFFFNVFSISKARAIECESDCTEFADCKLKIDCDELCVEHSNSLKCGSMTYLCLDNCGC